MPVFEPCAAAAADDDNFMIGDRRGREASTTPISDLLLYPTQQQNHPSHEEMNHFSSTRNHSVHTTIIKVTKT
jgi:hypothetical protein